MGAPIRTTPAEAGMEFTDEDLGRWRRALDTWWYRRGERAASTVRAWASLPGREEVLRGTLWWIDSELGELLTLWEDGEFRDLLGRPMDAVGSAWLWHPADGRPDDAMVWMDRARELGCTLQVDRPVWAARWNEGKVVFPGTERLRTSERLRSRGWTRIDSGRLQLPLFDVRARIQLVPPNLYEEGEGTLYLMDNQGKIAWSDLLTDAVLSELIADAREALGYPQRD